MTIYVTAISHRHGATYYANTTQEGATKNLADYCRAYWTDPRTNPGVPIPDTDQACIDTFFSDEQDSEFFEITPLELED